MMSVFSLASAAFSPGAAISRASVPSARSAVSMVNWVPAPPDLGWAEAAWNNMGLTSYDLGPGCIMIPSNMAPNPTREVRCWPVLFPRASN